jgi:hypothetical protein
VKLWRHLLAHKRQPFYAFCEWYALGRDSVWADAPVELETSVSTRACACMQISGPLVSASCDAHGPLNVMSVSRPM